MPAVGHKRRNPFTSALIAYSSLGFARLMGCLPLAWARCAARGLARIAYYAVPRIRRVGLSNLSLAYGDTLTSAERTKILKRAVENVAVVAAEFPRIASLKGPFLEAQVTVKGLENLPRESGAIIIGAHLGNWEWMAAVLVQKGFEVAEVVRPLDDPRMDRYIDTVRCSSGVRTIPKDNAGREILNLLGENCLVGILIDQSPRDSAVPARFFGRDCWATAGAAALALRARVPLIPVSMTRRPKSEGNGYTLELYPAVPIDPNVKGREGLIKNTQKCQDAIEQIIRACPEQWLWLHRRWKPRPRLEEEWRRYLQQQETDLDGMRQE